MEVSSLLQALPEDGCLVACEKDQGPLQLARDFWHRAGVAHKVRERKHAFPTLFSSACQGHTLSVDILHYQCWSAEPLLRLWADR